MQHQSIGISNISGRFKRMLAFRIVYYYHIVSQCFNHFNPLYTATMKMTVARQQRLPNLQKSQAAPTSPE
jgi:hypothetical protein